MCQLGECMCLRGEEDVVWCNVVEGCADSFLGEEVVLSGGLQFSRRGPHDCEGCGVAFNVGCGVPVVLILVFVVLSVRCASWTRLSTVVSACWRCSVGMAMYMSSR